MLEEVGRHAAVEHARQAAAPDGVSTRLKP